VLWVEETGSGSPVVLIHNGVMDARTWNPQWRAFGERYHVVRYDSPGFGRTPPLEEPYRETDLLAELLDELGIETAALVGGSRGGRIAVDFALAYPETVTALVLVGGALSGYPLEAYTAEQQAREEAALEAGDWETVADVTLEVWGAVGPDDGVRELVVANARADILTEQEQPPERLAVDHLDVLRLPILAITGEHDQPGIEEVARLLESRVGADHVSFEDSDHFPNMREPERFNEVVLDFLARVRT
jgi:3-oxoadipate enol-lactonase